MILIVVNLIVLIVGLSYLVYILQNTFKSNILNENNIVFNSVLIILFAIFVFTPIIIALKEFTFSDFTNKVKNDLGGTIGGITAPFVSLLGSYLVYLGFKAQIDANKKIQSQIDSEHFNKMIFLIFENIKDFSIKNASVSSGKSSINQLFQSMNNLNNLDILDLKSFELLLKTINTLLIELENKKLILLKNIIAYQYEFYITNAFNNSPKPFTQEEEEFEKHKYAVSIIDIHYEIQKKLKNNLNMKI